MTATLGELAVCPYCGLTTTMNATEWGRHVDDCAAIAEGLRREAARKAPVRKPRKPRVKDEPA